VSGKKKDYEFDDELRLMRCD